MFIFSLLQLIEGFALYLIITTLAGLKGKISLLKIGFLSILHGIIYYIVNDIFPFGIHGIILIILSILISSLVLELDFVLSLISTIISILIIITLDFILTMCFLSFSHLNINKFMNNIYMRNWLTFVMQIIFLIISILIYKKNINIPKKFFLNKKTSLLISSLFFIICIFAIFTSIISIYIESSAFSKIYIFLVITFISFSLMIYKLNQYIISMTAKEIQLEDQKIYIEYIKELMSHLKAQRHEFINHINVLYGLVQIKDLKRLEAAKEYIENLNITIQTTSHIMSTDEPVVSGLLFTKTAIAEQNNIEMDVHIVDKITDTPLSLTEISIVLNNLINNAIEFSQTLPEENRYISIEIMGDEKNIYIDICNENNGQPIPDTDIIFKKGFSTKSLNKDSRGFGLYNVKSIIEKHHGTIKVDSDLQETSFKITLPKK
ncbi:sensor histidine kinase [Defluviitalea phaphyphila]|uniref:sensor histidine kinase n=1 Tax=Defluviitalea phaphyphila TaxID=1473580 RepID=UPI000731B4D6|nr:GHKL domain-containing protein [Defluviitalea phaphyphila]